VPDEKDSKPEKEPTGTPESKKSEKPIPKPELGVFEDQTPSKDEEGED